MGDAGAKDCQFLVKGCPVVHRFVSNRTIATREKKASDRLRMSLLCMVWYIYRHARDNDISRNCGIVALCGHFEYNKPVFVDNFFWGPPLGFGILNPKSP